MIFPLSLCQEYITGLWLSNYWPLFSGSCTTYSTLNWACGLLWFLSDCFKTGFDLIAKCSTVGSTNKISFSGAKRFTSAVVIPDSPRSTFSPYWMTKSSGQMFKSAVQVLAQSLGQNEGSVLAFISPYLPIRNHGSLPFIRLTPMLCLSVQEDHSHYLSCSTLASAQKPGIHLVIWVPRAHQGRRQQRAVWKWYRYYLQTFMSCLDYTGSLRVHAWQRRCSWGHAWHISSSGFCQ